MYTPTRRARKILFSFCDLAQLSSDARPALAAVSDIRARHINTANTSQHHVIYHARFHSLDLGRAPRARLSKQRIYEVFRCRPTDESPPAYVDGVVTRAGGTPPTTNPSAARPTPQSAEAGRPTHQSPDQPRRPVGPSPRPPVQQLAAAAEGPCDTHDSTRWPPVAGLA